MNKKIVWYTDLEIPTELFCILEVPEIENLEDTCYVYHYPHPNKSGIQDGYVGVTNNPQRRFLEHSGGKMYGGNTRFFNALRKYEDVHPVIIAKGNLGDCLKIELYLRPSESIGWNHAKGGGYPPLCTEESYRKRVETLQDMGFYSFEETSKRTQKSADTKSLQGFYSFEETQRRISKSLETMRSRGKDFLRNRSLKSVDTMNARDPEFIRSKNIRAGAVRKSRHPVFNKKVTQLNKNREIIKLWDSVYEAAENLCIPPSYIGSAIAKKELRKGSFGYVNDLW